MDYRQIYDTFISDRKRKGPPVGYSEKHHIVPRSLGGDDSPGNLVRLSARDHYFAHCCLAKIHGGEMWTALHLMGRTQKKNAAPFRTGRLFAVARERAAAQRSEHMTAAWALGEFERDRTYGPVSAATKAKLSAASKGRKPAPGAIEKSVATKQSAAPKLCFVELATRREFHGTALEFRRMSGIGQSHVSLLVRGRTEAAKGWVLKGNEDKPRGNRDRTVRVFRHKDGREFVGTAYDFNAAHIGDPGMVSNCINGKNGVKSARGWAYAGER